MPTLDEQIVLVQDAEAAHNSALLNVNTINEAIAGATAPLDAAQKALEATKVAFNARLDELSAIALATKS